MLPNFRRTKYQAEVSTIKNHCVKCFSYIILAFRNTNRSMFSADIYVLLSCRTTVRMQHHTECIVTCETDTILLQLTGSTVGCC